MATFYIDSSEGIFELTATTNIRVEQSSTPTKHKLESGETIVDNVVNDNTRIFFDGIISEIKSITLNQNEYDNNKNTSVSGTSVTTVKSYLTALRKIRDNKELFSVIYDNGRFEPVKNCVITNLNISRDSNTGTAYSVSLAFEQIRLSERARLSVKREVQKNPDDTQNKTDSSGSNTEKVKISTSFGGTAYLGVTGQDIQYLGGAERELQLVPRSQ